VEQQRAAYDATVDAYRQTVLTAFQQVEDNLAALRILEEESAKTDETIQSSDRAWRVSTAQYRAGTTSYPNGPDDPSHAIDCSAERHRFARAVSHRERAANRSVGGRSGYI
jgi:hypothetical protein